MDVKELLRSVLDGEEYSLSLQVLPIECYSQMLKELGATEGEFETNGWSVDFWQYYEYKGNRFSLAGSLYYGDYNFRKVE